MHLERMELVATVAKMYFEDGMTQSQIASRFGYSRSMISRFLIEARENNIVEIRINYPLERDEALETQLMELYDLKVVRVLARRILNQDLVLRQLGIMAARLLDELVGPCMTIGVAWGASLSELLNSVSTKSFLDIHVVQLAGSPGVDPDYDGPALVQKLARSYGGSYSIFPSPLIVDNENTRDSLMKDRRIRAVLLNAEDMDIALLGIGAINSNNSRLIQSCYITPEELQDLEKAGAVGHICASFFDMAGNLIDHSVSRRSVGVSAETIREAPIRLGIAAGQQKILSTVGALQGGFVNILITDDVIAREVIKHCQSIPATNEAS